MTLIKRLPFSLVTLLAKPQSDLIPKLLATAKQLGIVVEIVNITGGPAGGKTTLLTQLEFECYQRGWLPIMIPEAATIVRSMGFMAEKQFCPPYGKATHIISNHLAQAFMLQNNESNFVHALVYGIQAAYEQGHQRIVFFRDRTSLDARWYMDSPEAYEGLVREMNLNIHDLAPGALTILLNSLAVDDPDLYLKVRSSNPVRFETPERAAAANQGMVDAYTAYGINPVIIRNGSGGFDGKMQEAKNEVFAVLGLPKVQQQSLIIVKGLAPDILKCLGFSQESSIKVTTLYDVDDGGARYRETCFPMGSVVYTKTVKSETGKKGARFDDMERITSEDYFRTLRRLGSNRHHSVKRRFVGMHRDHGGPSQFLKVDVYHSGLVGETVRVEIDVIDGMKIPECIARLAHKDVTGEPGFSDADIAAGRFVCPELCEPAIL